MQPEPSVAGPGLLAPPGSKPLRFRHSGSLQRRRLGWACVEIAGRATGLQQEGERFHGLEYTIFATRVPHRADAAYRIVTGSVNAGLLQVAVPWPTPSISTPVTLTVVALSLPPLSA